MIRTVKLRNLCNYFAITSLRVRSPPSCACGEGTLVGLAAESSFFSLNFSQQQQRRQFQSGSVLQKYNKRSNQDIDSDDENENEDFKDERDSKVVKTKVNSLRADLLLKAGLNMARNKVETFFFENKIRINGKKVPKKSVQLTVGDEMDVVRGFSQTNPSHLVISRVIILAADPRDDDSISVQLRRYKSLLIENYSGPNAYKSSDAAAEH